MASLSGAHVAALATRSHGAIRTANATISIFMGVVVTLACILRIYVKVRVSRKAHLEDWTCAVAWIIFSAYLVCVFMMLRYGAGSHIDTVTPSMHRDLLKWLYASSVVYCPGAFFTKVTLLLLVKRVFSVVEHAQHVLSGFIYTMIAYYLPGLLIRTLICIPISAVWDEGTHEARCLHQRQVLLADCIVSVVVDGAILAFPMLLTWSLAMPFMKEVKIVVLLGAGGTAMLVTILRLYLVLAFQNSTNAPRDSALIALTTTLELGIGIICSCVPSVNLIRRHFKRLNAHSTPNVPRTRISDFRIPRDTIQDDDGSSQEIQLDDAGEIQSENQASSSSGGIAALTDAANLDETGRLSSLSIRDSSQVRPQNTDEKQKPET